MNEQKLRKLIELIDELIRENGPWKDKKAAIIVEASTDEQVAISEFAAWWE